LHVGRAKPSFRQSPARCAVTRACRTYPAAQGARDAADSGRVLKRVAAKGAPARPTPRSQAPGAVRQRRQSGFPGHGRHVSAHRAPQRGHGRSREAIRQRREAARWCGQGGPPCMAPATAVADNFDEETRPNRRTVVVAPSRCVT
jgi:hypothetical protein